MRLAKMELCGQRKFCFSSKLRRLRDRPQNSSHFVFFKVRPRQTKNSAIKFYLAIVLANLKYPLNQKDLETRNVYHAYFMVTNLTRH